MKERVHQFGINNALIGITTEPEEGTASSSLPAVIFLNSGLLHHVGMSRFHVHLSRILAAQGYISFRFDLSGIGDSITQKGPSSVVERSINETREALDYIQSSLGVDHFVLFGLCTGADNGHRVAVADERVCGTVLLDGYTYPTVNFVLHRYKDKVFNIPTWYRFLRRCLFPPTSNEQNVETDSTDVLYAWQLPPKQLVKQQLEQLVSRRVQLLQIFTGASQGYNYQQQFQDAFRSVDFGTCIKVEYFENSDHTFTLLNDRDALTSLIVDWMNTRF
ncbi:MAG: hypothetical protein GY746_16965 [Gammaproteobacteria bacterium]|nr:hypothetical protein [Gammaproteobacteria bacterium]